MDTAGGSGVSEPSRGRGRGSRGSHKPRGGLGKYLRARGRGRGGGGGRGRPAEFHQRLLLEGERAEELDEEEAEEQRQRYSRRDLGTNAARYQEPEPELDEHGEVVEEPEVDLSSFLERQRLEEDSGRPTPGPSSAPPPPDDDDEVDESLGHLPGYRAGGGAQLGGKKGRVQQIEWDESLEEMLKEKAIADASRELKDRFRAQSVKPSFRGTSMSQRARGASARQRGEDRQVTVAPPLPGEEPARIKDPNAKDGMEDFLDDLLV